MNRAELVSLIKDTAGSEIAAAVARQNERAKDVATQIVATPEQMVASQSKSQMAQSLEGEKRGLALGGAIMCLAAAEGNLEKAIALSKTESWKTVEGVGKILEAGAATSGGVLVSPEHSQEIIDLLAPRAVVRRHITNSMDVSAGMIDIARMTSDASTSWGGETEPIREGEPTTDQLVMRAFQQKVLIPVSNTLLSRGGERVSAMVRNSTLRAMALGEDQVFLTSPGSEHRPKGLKFWAPSQNRIHAQSSFSLTTVNQDLGAMVLLLEEANVPMTSPVWFFAPRTKQYLMQLQTTTGIYAFRDEMIGGTLWGIPYEATTHIPRNEGSGSDESSIYLTDADELVLGQGASLNVALSTEGTFVDADDNVVSAFQRNLTLLRIINEVDLKPRHVEAVAFMDQVKWSPA